MLSYYKQKCKNFNTIMKYNYKMKSDNPVKIFIFNDSNIEIPPSEHYPFKSDENMN